MSCLGPSPNYWTTVMKDNPTAYWRLGESSLITAADEKGLYPGTYVGSPVSAPGAVAGNASAKFNGASQYIAGTTLGSLGSSLGSGLTVEAWVNKTNAADADAIASTVNTGTSTYFALAHNLDKTSQAVPDAMMLYFRGSDGITRTGEVLATGLNAGGWHHVVATYTPTTLRLFIDGVEKTVTYGSTGTPATFSNFDFPVGIGARNLRGSYDLHFNGALDEVALYNYALTPTQVANHYAAAFKTSFTPSVLSPALWLSDTGASAGTWPDISGNGRDATGATPPTIVSGALNGRQVRRFNGTSQVLTSSLNINGYTGFSYAAVWKRTGTLVGFNCGYNFSPQKGLICDSSDTAGASLDGRPSGGAYYSSTAGSPSSSFCLAFGTYDLSNLRAYANGVQGTPTPVSSSSILAETSTSIGTLVQNNSAWCQGDIAEILIFPYALTTVQRRQVEAWLSAKYALPLSS